MNVFLVTSLVLLLTLIVGLLLMWLFVGASRVVVANEATIVEQEQAVNAINPLRTGGFAINPTKSLEEQVLQARKLAARSAARLPRGANMGIGRLGTTDAHKEMKHASLGVEKDPITAVKIAKYHTWNGLEYQSPTQVAAPAAVAAGGSATLVKRKLVAGQDYEVVPVSKEMPGPERRRAIIANAKAKMAAYKAMKASGQTMVEQVAAPVAAAAAPAAVAAAPAVDIAEPDYIEITDAMSPEDKRSAKIKNSKMKSAYKKALKAAGVSTTAPAAAPVAAAPVAAAPVAAAAPAAPSGDIPPPPEMIAITDDMAPDDKRAAKIANSKAKSAYKKQLKAMGIDPKSVKI